MAQGKGNVIGRWLLCFEPSGPLHPNKVASKTVHGGARLAMERLNCERCVEENKVCECGDLGYEGGELKGGDGDNRMEANSSFTHSVINMVGMLIGKAISNFLLYLFIYFFNDSSISNFFLHFFIFSFSMLVDVLLPCRTEEQAQSLNLLEWETHVGVLMGLASPNPERVQRALRRNLALY